MIKLSSVKIEDYEKIRKLKILVRLGECKRSRKKLKFPILEKKKKSLSIRISDMNWEVRWFGVWLQRNNVYLRILQKILIMKHSR